MAVLREIRSSDDIAKVLVIAQRMHEESNFSDMGFVPERMAQSLAAFASSDRHLVMLAEDSQGTIVGALIGEVFQADFSNELIAYDKGLYVLPELRGNFTAARLVQTYIAWAKDKGAKRICFDVRAGIDVERVTMFFQAMGFEPNGQNMLYRG